MVEKITINTGRGGGSTVGPRGAHTPLKMMARVLNFRHLIIWWRTFVPYSRNENCELWSQ